MAPGTHAWGPARSFRRNQVAGTGQVAREIPHRVTGEWIQRLLEVVADFRDARIVCRRRRHVTGDQADVRKYLPVLEYPVRSQAAGVRLAELRLHTRPARYW